eukprot:3037667-Rhodomonas_salina.3
MIVALYVDNGLTAHNNYAEYQKFITALSERFELNTESQATEVVWYLRLGVGVTVVLDWKAGTI